MKTRIIQTKQYNKFNFFHTNRPIKESHVKKLMLSIQQHGLLEEITVNENYDIIDGQHRYMALKKLQMPIYAKVKVGATIDSVLPSNLVRLGWTIESFLHHYARKGYLEYIEIGRAMKDSVRSSPPWTFASYVKATTNTFFGEVHIWAQNTEDIITRGPEPSDQNFVESTARYFYNITLSAGQLGYYHAQTL